MALPVFWSLVCPTKIRLTLIIRQSIGTSKIVPEVYANVATKPLWQLSTSSDDISRYVRAHPQLAMANCKATAVALL